MRKRMRKSAKPSNSPDKWNLFKRQRNMVIGLIRNSKQTYYRNLSEKMGSPSSISSQEWWKYFYTRKDNDN